MAKKTPTLGVDWHAFVWKYANGNLSGNYTSYDKPAEPPKPGLRGEWVRVKFVEVCDDG